MRLPLIAVCLAGLLVGCTSAASRAPAPSATTPPSVTSADSPSTPAPSTPSTSRAKPKPPRTPSRTPTRTPTHARPTASAARPPANRPVIVLDPGHAPTIQSVDPATGLVDSDYENEPEMRDVFAVAVLVKNQLQADGYRVVMTKNNVDDRVSLGQRAAIANQVHAALALSIHDQAGPNGGIGFDEGNNTVYYQSVGGYRETPSGKRITFTDADVAATSARYGNIFQAQRAAAEGHSIRLQGNVGYDLGGRGLAPGDMWMVQLLSKVPWIYNESGGNSAGMSGLNASDERRYARGLVESIEHCVPITR